MADFGGIVASALQGGAEVVGRQAQDALADQRKLDITKQISQMDEEKQMRIAEATANLKLKTDQQSREQERDFSVDPKTLDATGKVLDNKNAHTAYHTRLGDEIRTGDDKLIASNKGLTNAEARAPGGGAGKVDHYDDKVWEQYTKADPALVSFTDPITQKQREVPELRNVYVSEYNRLREQAKINGGSASVASEQARNTVIKLRNAAEDLANSDEGKKANMTPEQATKQLLKEFEQARRAAPAQGAAPAASPAAADKKTGVVNSARKETASNTQAADRLDAAASQLGWVGSRGSDGKMYYQQVDKTRPGRKPYGPILNEQQMADKAGLIWE